MALWKARRLNVDLGQGRSSRPSMSVSTNFTGHRENRVPQGDAGFGLPIKWLQLDDGTTENPTRRVCTSRQWPAISKTATTVLFDTTASTSPIAPNVSSFSCVMSQEPSDEHGHDAAYAGSNLSMRTTIISAQWFNLGAGLQQEIGGPLLHGCKLDPSTQSGTAVRVRDSLETFASKGLISTTFCAWHETDSPSRCQR